MRHDCDGDENETRELHLITESNNIPIWFHKLILDIHSDLSISDQWPVLLPQIIHFEVYIFLFSLIIHFPLPFSWLQLILLFPLIISKRRADGFRPFFMISTLKTITNKESSSYECRLWPNKYYPHKLNILSSASINRII